MCCIIILTALEVQAKKVLGLQPWVTTQIGDVTTNLEENSHGPEKCSPDGPTCHPNGKVVETFSEKVSMTSKFLTQVLKHLDTHLCWDQTQSTPFLLHDGHGSHFELPFPDWAEKKWSIQIKIIRRKSFAISKKIKNAAAFSN
jgi:hypothetical protein